MNMQDLKKWFETTNYKMSFDDYMKCNCEYCNKDCIHKNALRRLPKIDGGLGLCKNLEK